MSGSDDEDYMSADFIDKINNVKPGISQDRTYARHMKINARNVEAMERENSRITRRNRDEVARSRLEEAISQPISSESKGFKLLAKMGYKPGMSLGVKREGGEDGIKEPISVNLKIDRKGIGVGKRETSANCRPLSEPIDIETRISEFRTTKKLKETKKNLISDLVKLRKACQDLDVRIGKDRPEREWFWPIYKRTCEGVSDLHEDESEIKLKRPKHEASDQVSPMEDAQESFVYSNGLTAPNDVDYQSLDDERIMELLREVVGYLRSEHIYCGYCGSTFESQEDINFNCPGPFKDDHDE